MKDLIIIGVDPSLQAAGLAILEFTGNRVLKKYQTHHFGTSSKLEGDTRRFRYDCIANQLCEHISNVLGKYDNTQVDVLVAFEHYIMAGRGRICNAAELAGYMKGVLINTILEAHDSFWEHRIAEIPPSTLKQFATGKGNSDKDQMRNSFYTRYKIDIKDDNECDAFWAAQFINTITDESTAPVVRTRWNQAITWF